MLKRAKRKGIDADYLIADAWFGTKRMMTTAYDAGLNAILRMKKNKMKYKMTLPNGKKKLLDAQEIYAYAVKGAWAKVQGLPWKSVAIEVEINLPDGERKSTSKECWRRIKLLFVRGINEPEKPTTGKKDWALFLSTDPKISNSKMLEVYALRWGIEVYFKEAKQYLGFLKEQTRTFLSHTASIHLCALRYLILVQNKLEGNDCRVSDVRQTIKEQLNKLTYAGHLWKIFRALVSNSLTTLKPSLGCSVNQIMEIIDTDVKMFFVNSLQLDALTMELEFE